jgi:BASS family bile acid:Na+ symporter
MNLDEVQVHFNPNQLFVLNAALSFLMFGVALEIKLDDFKKVFQYPKISLVALTCQYILFPLLTLLIIYTCHPATSVAMGLILVSACPSGNMANYMTHHAKANVALSVTLNSVIVLLAFIMTPLVYGFWSQFVPDAAVFNQNIHIDPMQIVKIIFNLILIPLCLGIGVTRFFPTVTPKIKPYISIASLVIFFGCIAGALINNWAIVSGYFWQFFFIVLLHNSLALLMGYWFARLNRLEETDCRTISIESGIHNTALGLILIFQFFNGIGGMAVIAAWWGIWDLIAVFGLASWWRGRESKRESIV